MYTILASIKFQLIFNWPMSKLAVDAKAGWNVLVNLFGAAPLVYGSLRLGMGLCTGQRSASKSVYIMNGTLAWFCPSWKSTNELGLGISIFTALLSLQYS